jgi:hypothetical protein
MILLEKPVHRSSVISNQASHASQRCAPRGVIFCPSECAGNAEEGAEWL